MTISQKVQKIAPSLTLEITAKAKKLKAEGVSVIGFGAGEPDFNTPEYINNSAKKAIDDGFTKYTPASGMVELKKAICEKFKKDNGLEYVPEQIVISTGAKSSLYHAICAIIDDGDQVILPSPYWLTYPELVGLAGGETVYVKTDKSTGYKMTASQLKSAITNKTKALILNSPNNPTGSVYTKEEIIEIAKVCQEYGLYVVSDEIYEKLIYDGEEHYSIASVNEYMKEHTIVINGVSKSYAMTGWRIGYLAAPIKIAKAISSMQSHTTSNACSISQYASVTALTAPEGDEFISKMQKIFDDRRKFMIEKLSKFENIEIAKPSGAFYVFIDVSKNYGKSYDGSVINGSMSFADLALKEGVALIPGVAFGDDNCVRLSYAISMEDIEEGLNRLNAFLSKLK
ncbi:MAG: pyridoxal phosphate-dependent aminotransferase [Clostridia bacterium]|nr:pyridoxal phosphate-dependent aminotransferase [Clostridia bacterium]